MGTRRGCSALWKGLLAACVDELAGVERAGRRLRPAQEARAQGLGVEPSLLSAWEAGETKTAVDTAALAETGTAG